MAPARGGAAGDGKSELPSSVLIYSHSWLPGQIDGVAVRMMAHAKSLSERGAKVTVVTPDFVREGGAAAPKLDAIPGVEHVVVQSQPTPVYRKNLCMKLSVHSFWKLVGVIRRVKPDLVHGTQEASIQVLATACMFCDVPLVVSMHTDVAQIAVRDQGFSWFLGGGLIGRLYSRAAIMCVHLGYRNWGHTGAKFLCVSPQSRTILRNAGVLENRVCPGTWGPMVDRQTFRLDLPEDQVAALRRDLCFGIEGAFLMLYVGRVTAEKDVQFLVDALKRAPKRVVLALIGPGSMCEELKKFHGKEHRLHCTGEMRSREDVAMMLRGADCCVSASTMETVGFTAMEALSCGTPCLMANAQGFALHLTHGVNARLWTPHSEESFDKELALLMAERREGCWSAESLRESMVDASVDACTDRVLKAYQAVDVVRDRYWRVIVGLALLLMNLTLTIFIP